MDDRDASLIKLDELESASSGELASLRESFLDPNRAESNGSL